MNVWESKDLIHWSDVRQFDVAFKCRRRNAGLSRHDVGRRRLPGCRTTTERAKEPLSYTGLPMCTRTRRITSVVGGGSDIMYGVTTDFTQDTWEYGGLFLDGGSAGWIDTNILQANGKTYHITKSNSEQIIMESTEAKTGGTMKQPHGPGCRATSARAVSAPWKALPPLRTTARRTAGTSLWTTCPRRVISPWFPPTWMRLGVSGQLRLLPDHLHQTRRSDLPDQGSVRRPSGPLTLSPR